MLPEDGYGRREAFRYEQGRPGAAQLSVFRGVWQRQRDAARPGLLRRSVDGFALRHLSPSSTFALTTPIKASVTALQVDSTECRYLLAGASNGALFVYDLEAKRGLGAQGGEREGAIDPSTSGNGTGSRESRTSGRADPFSPEDLFTENSLNPLFCTSEPPRRPAGAAGSDADVDQSGAPVLVSPARPGTADGAGGEGARSRGGHQYRVSSVEWYPVDTGLFLSASFDSTIRVWDANTVQTELVFDMASRVYSISMPSTHSSPAHSLVAAGSHSPNIRLCDLNTGTCSHILAGHQEAVISVRWLPCSDWELVSSSRDGAIKQWDVRRTFPCLRSLDCTRTQPSLRAPLASPGLADHWAAAQAGTRGTGFGGPRGLLEASARGRQGMDSPARGGRSCSADALFYPGSVVRGRGAVVLLGGKQAKKAQRQAGSTNQEAVGQSRQNPQGVQPRAHEGAATCVHPVLGGLFLLSVGSEPRIRLWDMDSGQNTLLHYPLPKLPPSLAASSSMVCETPLSTSPDGSLAFVPWGQTVRVFNTWDASCRAVLKGHYDRVLSCCLRPGLPQMFTGGGDGQILAWEYEGLASTRVEDAPVPLGPRGRWLRSRRINHVLQPLADEDYWSD